MRSYLNNLGEFSLEKIQEIKENSTASILDEYEQKLHDPDYVEEILFNNVDVKGNLYTFRDDVRIMMRNTDIFSGRGGTDLAKRSRLIGKTYKVKIKKIDRENKTVWVSARKILSAMKAELEADIDKAFKTRQPMVVAAKVIAIEEAEGYAVCDLFGCGVLAILPRSKWSKNYVTSFAEAGVKVNDVIQARLMLQARRLEKYNNRVAYVISREDIFGNPYDGLESKYPVGSLVVIKAVQLCEHNFFGRIDGLDNLDVYCSYPGDKHFGDKAVDIPIKLGHYYAAYVKTVDEKHQRFRAKVYTKTSVNGVKEAADITEEQIRKSVAQEVVAPQDLERDLAKEAVLVAQEMVQNGTLKQENEK